MNDVLLEVKGVSKSFPGVQALKNVNFTVRKGEVHALMGENGAGKSTLMKILIGLNKKDSGEIFFEGKPLKVNSPKESLDAGICMIHQELSPILDMTVADNLFIGRQMKYKHTPFIDRKRQFEQTKKLFEELEIGEMFSPQTLLRDLSVAQMQMVEIVKAVSRESKIILMDEPTSALSESEVDVLFRMIRNLKSKGVSIVYISHRMDEIFQISDRITVFRDGCFIGEEKASEITKDQLISMMVGRELNNIFPKYQVPIGETIFEVKGLTHKGVFEDVSFSVKKGEILGITGLVGAGRSEIVKSIVGYDPLDAGEIFLGGKKLSIKHTSDAIREGVILVTEDRKELGLVVCRSILENISLASLKQISKWSIINRREEKKRVLEMAKSLNVKMSGPQQLVENLSGGNQQKVVLAKWLLTHPKVLILDEPTRGIDVGAKSEIHKMICDLASQGIAIILISSEMPEIMGMSDRIIIVSGGRIRGECSRDDADSETIIRYALGGV